MYSRRHLMAMPSSETERKLARDVDEWALAVILRGLAPFLSPDLLDRALAVARNIRDGNDLLEALNGLGPYLHAEAQLEAAREALDTAWRLSDDDQHPDDFYFATLLNEIVSWIPDASMQETLARVAEADIRDYDRVDVVDELMPYLPDALKAPALDLIWEPSAPSRSYHWMSDIASHLTSDLALRVYEAILEQGDLQYHASTLVRLAPRLPEEKRAGGSEIALSAVREVESVSVRTSWLVELAPHLPPRVRFEVLAELLADIRRVGNAGDRAGALTKLAPHLPEDERQRVLREALVAARSLQRIVVRTSFLIDIVPLLSGSEKDEALREIFAFLKVPRDADIRNALLSEIASHLSGPVQAETIAMLGEIEHIPHLGFVLSRLAPSLDEQGQRVALAVVGGMTAMTPCANALGAFALHFTAERKAEAIQGLARLLADLAGTEPPAGPSQPDIDAAVAGALEALSAAAK